MPAIGGLLRIGSRSPDSRLSQFRPGIADSLWPIFEIFPFSGDCGRRPGSIYTVWPNRHRARRSTMIYAKLDVDGLRSVELIATVDNRAAQRQDKPGRSEGIRRLVELG